MQAVHDETFCGPVCQHPSCWNSQRRCQRGLPRTRYVSSDSNSDDEGLPTQKVVNLLEDYGEDTRDRYPTKFGGRPKHERVGSIANLVRTKTRESFPKVRAPNATPASPMRLATLSGHNIPIKGAMNKVEVQEVFDLDDLQSDWHETFQAKKYYVWVPNPNKKKPRTPLDPAQSLSLKELSRGPTVLNPKDVTEDMVPEELELQRLNEMMRRDRRYDCKTPTGGQPYTYPLTQGGDYNGLYDLLDLPREVLADIVNHIEGRELKSKHQFVEAVIRTLPKLEKNHTAISLASSNVLLQRPIKLLDGDLRNSKGMMPFTSKQVYQLDDKVLDHLSTANEPPASQRPTDRSVDAATQGAPPPPASARAQKGEPPALNKKKPLPAIGDGEEKKEDDQAPEPTIDELEMADEKKKIPSIALGLPTIPTGLRYTKTFTYNQQDFDFTLCPIPSPLQAIMNPSPRSNSTTPGPLPSPSSVHGTVPTDTLRQETATPGQEEPQRENTRGTFYTDLAESMPSTPWNMPSVTQMVIHMPKTPNPTPVTRQSTFITDLDTTFTPDPGMTFAKGLDPGMSPAPPTTPRQPTIVTQKSLALTPDTSGLHPIAESDQNDPANEELGPIRHQMPRRLPHSRSNHRSVHFAPATSLPLPDAPMIPPQPPSSPNESEEVSMTPTPWAVSQAQLSSANYQAFARQEAEGLMVIGKGTKGSGGLAGPAGGYILQPRPPQGVRTSNVPTTASTTSPEPWPQLDEEAYVNKSLPRTPSSPPKSAGAKSGLSDATRTTEASARHPTRSAASSGSRESSMAKRLLQQEGQLESPAPPPPSPEPRDMAIHPPLTTTITTTTTTTTTNPTTGITTSGGANGKSPTKSPAGSVVNPLLTMVAEGDESESDITISAKPPSNLDSVSRIQSPRSMANSRPLTRDTSLLMSREVTNASGIVIPDGEPGPSRESTQDNTSNGQWAQKEQEEQQRSGGNQGNTQQGQPAVRKSLEQFDASEESLRQELESEYEKLAKQL